MTPPWLLTVRRFVRRHGWRAYALPVLAIVTIVALTTAPAGRPAPATRPPAGTALAGNLPADTPAAHTAPAQDAPSTPPSAGRPSATPGSGPVRSGTVRTEAPGQTEYLGADALPPGAKYTEKGAGTFRVLPGSSPAVGTGPLRRYVIEVENGVSGIDTTAFADAVVSTLSDKRSWTANGAASLQRVSSVARADFRVALTSALTVRNLCGYEQKIETSCWEDTHGPSQVNLNVARWVRGDTQFAQDLPTYHLYMINHEVGHAIGHGHSFTCLPGGLAPVMMQQTITLKENQGAGPGICQPNAWPFPSGIDPKVAVTS